MELETDVLIVGAGCGGFAAALATASLGRAALLVAPSRWLGGQLTAQAVPPDEHPWVETTGITPRTVECAKPSAITIAQINASRKEPAGCRCSIPAEDG